MTVERVGVILSLHYSQFGPHREDYVIRIEKPTDDRNIIK